MGMMSKKPELLAPAGSFDGMRAAINAGADAVYMGGSRFGARAYADNPDETGLLKAMEFCHLRNKKLYLTVNTLLRQDELEKELYKFLLPYYKEGLDAVIVQDLGVMEFIGRYFPGLDIHVSTQASVTMAEGIDAIRNMVGNPKSITRVVPARELGIDELRRLRRDTDLELEVFVHGALCVCYSGQCLLSSLAGGRSGNRGRCAQPCRRLYGTEINGTHYEGYYLSPKDMCTLSDLSELMDCGIDSFKIEGRMKSAEYAAGVVSVYRDRIDCILAEGELGDVSKKDGSVDGNAHKGVGILKEIYNRGGFNGGYLHEHNGQDMMSVYRPGHYGVQVGSVERTEGRNANILVDDNLGKGDVLEIRGLTGEKVYEFTLGEEKRKFEEISVLTMKERLAQKGDKVYRTKNAGLLEGLNKGFVEKDVRVPIDIELRAKLDEPLSLCFRVEFDDGKGYCAVVTGNAVQRAVNSASTADSLIGLVSKLGNTDFTASSVKYEVDDGVFIPVGEVKRLKRECVEQLKAKIFMEGHRLEGEAIKFGCEDMGACGATHANNKVFSVLVRTMDQLKSVLETDSNGSVSEVYLDFSSLGDLVDEALKLVEASKRKAFIKLPRIIRSGDYDALSQKCKEYLKRTGFIATNYEAVALLKGLGAEYRTDYNIYCWNKVSKECLDTGYTLPLELNSGDLRALADSEGEVVIYGLLPVMVSAQCAYKTISGRCGPHDDLALRDEKGFAFRSHSECRYCYNVLYNSSVLSLLHRMDELRAIDCGRYRLEFTFESATETALVVRELSGVLSGRQPALPSEMMGLKLTNGHFNRGAE